MNCSICTLPFQKGDRVREDFFQTVFQKPLHYAHEQVDLMPKKVLATYWGIYRGEEHDPVSLMHVSCYKNKL